MERLVRHFDILVGNKFAMYMEISLDDICLEY
jgi:hypothetical protein